MSHARLRAGPLAQRLRASSLARSHPFDEIRANTWFCAARSSRAAAAEAPNRSLGCVMSASGIESRGACKNRRRVPRRSAPCPTRGVDRRGADHRPDDAPNDTRRSRKSCRSVRSAAQVRRRVPDPRSRDRGGDQHQPHASPIARGPSSAAGRPGSTVGGHSRSDGSHARLHEHEVLSVRIGPMGVGGRRRAQCARRREHRRLPQTPRP